MSPQNIPYKNGLIKLAINKPRRKEFIEKHLIICLQYAENRQPKP